MADAPAYVYKPVWVANTFLWRAREDNVSDVTPLKVQKLVYNMQGWHLATTGVPAVGEQFEAWPKGPVLSSLYHVFKKYRWNRITELAEDIEPATGEVKALIVATSDEQFYSIFNAVWNRYKGYDGIQLSALTHAPGTPWTLARERGDQYIPDQEIRRHFVELGQRAA
jgi:uncharacterized phage-associated protein